MSVIKPKPDELLALHYVVQTLDENPSYLNMLHFFNLDIFC